MIYDQAFNVSFYQKLESLEHEAALTIIGAIKGISNEKIYSELDLESP